MTRATTGPPPHAPAAGASTPVPAPVPARSLRGGGRARFVLVGGVPGAGKSTALARVSTALPGVTVLDSEAARRRLRAWFPSVPYGALRPAVHAWHAARVLGAVLAGPGGGATGENPAVLVHDPATRRWRRAVLAFLARARGWEPVLVLLDVGLDDARRGQHDRGRVVRGRAFERHWRRWMVQRSRLRYASDTGAPWAGWVAVHVVDRRSAPVVMASLVE